MVTDLEGATANPSAPLIVSPPLKKKRGRPRKDEAQLKKNIPGKKIPPGKAEKISLEMMQSTGTQTQLSVKEILAIIKTCHESKVSSFEYLGLSLSFQGPVAKLDLPKTFSETPRPQAKDQSSGQGHSTIQRWNAKEAKKSDEMASLLVDDPLAYEQAMIDSMAQENVDERENG